MSRSTAIAGVIVFLLAVTVIILTTTDRADLTCVPSADAPPCEAP